MKLRDLRTQFGAKPNEEDLAHYRQSPNWRDGRFHNLEPTSLAGNIRDLPRMIYKQLTGQKSRIPERPLPLVPFDLTAWAGKDPGRETKLAWFGHSAVLLRMNNKTLLIDPMLGPDASPIAPIATKRFSENTIELIEQLPEIDLVLISHDHYDHLDLESIRRLRSKVHRFAVALGVKRHLVKWGIEPERVTEFDWWDAHRLQPVGGVDDSEDIQITFTPTRHFSGRGLSDRQQSLWGGWVFDCGHEKIWFSGDGGYGNHFAEIGRRLGPFDFALMECGQYNVEWPTVHLFPHESVQAAFDAGARKVMPVHCAGFCLSYQHNWFQPLEAFQQVAAERQLPYLLPPLGAAFSPADCLQRPWWLG